MIVALSALVRGLRANRPRRELSTISTLHAHESESLRDVA
jgi:hypothetical protein